MERITKRQKALYTACIFLSMWALSAIHSANGFLNTSIIDFYKLTEAGKGIPSAVSTICSMSAFMCVILLIGRVRKPVVTLTGAVVAFLANFLLYNNPPYPVFIVLLAFSGFACGCFDSVATASMSDLYTGRTSAQMMNAMHAVYGLSGFVMPFVYELVSGESTDFRVAYLPISICALLLGALLLAVTKGKFERFEAEDASGMRFSAPALKRLFTDKSILMMTAILFLLGMYVNGMLVWSKRFMSTEYQKYENATISLLYFCIAASRLTMSVVKVEPVKYVKYALPGAFVFLALAAFVPYPLMNMALFALSVLCFGPVIPFVLNMACKLVPSERFLASGVLLMFHFLGQTLFAPLFAQVETSAGIRWAMLFTAFPPLLSFFCAAYISGKEKNRLC